MLRTEFEIPFLSITCFKQADPRMNGNELSYLKRKLTARSKESEAEILLHPLEFPGSVSMASCQDSKLLYAIVAIAGQL